MRNTITLALIGWLFFATGNALAQSAPVSTLPDVGTPDAADLLYVVDVSEPVAADRSKSLQVGNLPAPAVALDDLTDVDAPTPANGEVLTYVSGSGNWEAAEPSGGGGGAGPSKILIQEITLSSPGEFDFDNIPQDYDRLIIEGAARGSVSSTGESVTIWFNNDVTPSNYHSQSLLANDGVANTGEAFSPLVGVVPADNAPSGAHSALSISVENYAGADLKTAGGYYTGMLDPTNVVGGSRHVGHASMTDPITRLRIRTDNHPTDGLTGTLRLYGERSISIEDSETITVKQAVPVSLVGGEFIIDLTDYQDGDRVVLAGEIRSSVASIADGGRLYLNGDTTDGNYYFQRLRSWGANTNSYEGAGAWVTDITGATAPAGMTTELRAVIEGYAGAEQKNVSSRTFSPRAVDEGHINEVSFRWGNSAAVTELRLRADGFPTDALSGTLHAYIEKEGVLPAIPTARGIHLIEEITNASAGDFDFNAIPQIYTRLLVAGEVRGVQPGVFLDGMRLFINGDNADANYRYQFNVGVNGVANVSEGPAAAAGTIPSTTAPANSYARVEIRIEGYAQTNRRKSYNARWESLLEPQHIDTGEVSTFHNSITAAITDLKFTDDAGGANGIVGTLRLYGEY